MNATLKWILEQSRKLAVGRLRLGGGVCACLCVGLLAGCISLDSKLKSAVGRFNDTTGDEAVRLLYDQSDELKKGEIRDQYTELNGTVGREFNPDAFFGSEGNQ